MRKNAVHILNKNAKQKRQDASLAVVVTLARWRLRQTWWQLLLTGAALLAACTIACVPTLFSSVADTAGLQALLNGSPTRTTLALSVSAQSISSTTVPATLQNFEKIIRPGLGSYLASTPASRVILASKLLITQPARLSQLNPVNAYATSLQRLQPALRLVQGRWASEQMVNGVIEFMLTAQTAQALQVTVGTTLTLQSGFTTPHSALPADPRGELRLRLVGIIANPPEDAPALYGETLQPVIDYVGPHDTFLMSDTAFLQDCDQIAAREGSAIVSAGAVDSLFHVNWYYHLSIAQIQFGRISDLATHLANVQYKVTALPINGSHSFPYVVDAEFFNPAPANADILSLLNQYASQVAIINLPILLLAMQIVALLLFFACLLVNQLIDRQVAMSAQFNSRGGSPRQMLWSLLAQVIGLALLALFLGPLLASLLVSQFASQILPANEQVALTALFSSPGQVVLSVAPYLAGTFLVGLLALGLPCRRASRVNILELRRETARASKQPFWVRYYLDLLAILLAFSGFGVALYLAQVAHVLDIRTQELVVAPLTLITPCFLLLGGLLLFLRAFPLALRLAARFARPARGATSLLALAQMARSPRQATHLVMLLALATAFASFSLVFSASQNQRALDFAAYESGADFAGDLPGDLGPQDQPSVARQYSSIPGVDAVSTGYTGTGTSSGLGGSDVPLILQAVDAQSFASAALWQTQYSSQPLSALMNLLVSRAPSASRSLVVPAIVDEAVQSSLHLTLGGIFEVAPGTGQLRGITLSFQVVAVVQHIPGAGASSDITDSSTPAGLLIDYQTFNLAYLNNQTGLMGMPGIVAQPLPLNYIWLRTGDSPATLARVRAALNSPGMALSNLFDRRQISADLQSDPLVFSILLMLSIGGITALCLAFLGNLLASWLNVRLRLNSFVVLRALGATRRQVVGILLWEQGIVYLTALLAGLVLGGVLIWLVIPQIIFTGLPPRGALSELSATRFYLLQRDLPARTIFPATLQLVLLLLILACALALLFMARIVLSASSAQELRLNED